MNSDITVTKADGGTESFDEDKLRRSLKQAEATKETIDEIVEHIKEEIQDGVKTADIYNHAFSQLKRQGGSHAARYSLRESLSDLGPTGYPFEHFVAQLFEAQGYETKVGIRIEGECITHEVDVLAESEDEIALVEAKFHNEHNIKSDVKTSLYIQSRFSDIKQGNVGDIDAEEKTIRCQLVTNTKFTQDAIDYGACTGLELIGWGYPDTNNLEELIYDANLEPVTALTSLNNRQKRHLIQEQNLVLCKDLRENKNALQKAGLTNEEIETVMSEVSGLCHF